MGAETIMEPVSIPTTNNGLAVIDAICSAIADRLAGDCNLRHTDCYRSFAAHVRIDLQLFDVGTTEVNNEVQIGAVDSKAPIIEIGIDIPDPKRTYVSRIRGSKPAA